MSTSLNPFWLVGITSIVALIPVLIGVSTCYLKVSIVFGLLRSGIGSQQVPGNLVIMTLSMALTVFIMGPVFEESSQRAGAVDFSMLMKAPSLAEFSKLAPVLDPWREFLRRHSGARELRALQMMDSSETGNGEGAESGPGSQPLGEGGFRLLIPAYLLTELKRAFATGFVLLLPFLVIDMIVANILAGMGMFMVSPQVVSLPLKLILFVVSDGWLLVSRGLINSYGP